MARRCLRFLVIYIGCIIICFFYFVCSNAESMEITILFAVVVIVCLRQFPQYTVKFYNPDQDIPVVPFLFWMLFQIENIFMLLFVLVEFN